jgi:hypothetical protein
VGRSVFDVVAIVICLDWMQAADEVTGEMRAIY